MRTLLLGLACLTCLGTSTFAQVPAAAPAPAPAPTVVPDLPSPPADYAYSPRGRRDPFMSLTTKTSVKSDVPPGTVLKGAAGLLVDDLNVRGIVQANGAYVAMVSGPNRQTYTVKAGTRLFDGTVQSISADAIVIVQQVSDPLSLQKQRQVRKPLRTQEEGK